MSVPQEPLITPDPRRRFSGRERTALYLAADGRCMGCGVELDPGWHADHVDPHVAGGPTDVINGQALCAACNLKKGATVLVTPRAWQRSLIAKYHNHTGPDFLCVACPGAGKTKGAGFIAKDLLESGEVDRILVVVPSFPLRDQWRKSLAEVGLTVDGSTTNMPGRDREHRPAVGEMVTLNGRRVVGWVVTYQSLAMAPEVHRVLNSRKRTLAILDEVHHLEVASSWGEAAIHALEPCARRLSLSGTPFRSKPTERIPFVEYDDDGWCRYQDRITSDGLIEVYPRGFDYSYGRALSDRPPVVRPAIFETFDGDVAWMEFGKPDPQEAQISDPSLSQETRRKVNRHALNPAGAWLQQALAKADRRLLSIRQEGDKTAKGLVVCKDTEHARRIVEVLGAVVSSDQVRIAVSRDGDGEDSTAEARTVIENFGKDPARWLVAVGMVSEGVDIPQMRVGVYVTTVRTRLYFRQVLGRFVRWRNDLDEEIDQTAHLFVPKDPKMTQLADEVLAEVFESITREDDEVIGCKPGEPRPDMPWQPQLDLDAFLRSTIEDGGFLLPGRGTVDHEMVEKIAAEAGKPASVVADILAAARGFGFAMPGQEPPQPRRPDQTHDKPQDLIKAKKNLLEKNLKQITSARIRKDGGEFGELIARVKAYVYAQAGIQDYRRADLPEIERAIEIARTLWGRL
jgi:superfamily II DNA or RNA helicase